MAVTLVRWRFGNGWKSGDCCRRLLSALRPTMSVSSIPSPHCVCVDSAPPSGADFRSRSLAELKVIRGDLWRALKDVRLPPPTSFSAFREECKLPYSVKERPLQTPSGEMLGYLSGFFAGHGCVRSNLEGLKMGQSVQGAEVLVLFTKFFGGSIGVHRAGTGTSFP